MPKIHQTAQGIWEISQGNKNHAGTPFELKMPFFVGEKKQIPGANYGQVDCVPKGNDRFPTIHFQLRKC